MGNIETSNNKRLAKNSMMLYLRMFVNMGISLYTSRLILNALGETDFGIYNVVGGIVVMFTFINGSMNSSTSRFLTISLAKGDIQDLKQTFSFTITIHAILAFIILLLAETVGLWFLYYKMVIPIERMNISCILYQLSVITTMISIMSVPYNASIISHEKMGAFAYISISDVVFKLLIVFAVIYLPWDRLLVYAILLFTTQLVNQSIYIIYCRKHFTEARFTYCWNKKLFKEMCSFAGWNMAGNLAFICYTQGLNLLINLFFGPSINAARGIAVRVQGIVSNFVSNFQTAIHPQITKSYATQNLEYTKTLIYSESKFSFYLLLILSLPIMIEAQTILTWWLINVPESTVIFLIIMLSTSFVESMINPLLITALATGNIKKLQIITCPILLSILPISYITLSLGASAYWVFIINFIILFITLIVRVIMIKPFIQISLQDYLKNILLRCILVGVLSSIMPLLVHYTIKQTLMIRFILVGVASVFSCCLSIYFLGLNSHEKEYVISFIKKIPNKYRSNIH